MPRPARSSGGKVDSNSNDAVSQREWNFARRASAGQASSAAPARRSRHAPAGPGSASSHNTRPPSNPSYPSREVATCRPARTLTCGVA